MKTTWIGLFNGARGDPRSGPTSQHHLVMLPCEFFPLYTKAQYLSSDGGSICRHHSGGARIVKDGRKGAQILRDDD